MAAITLASLMSLSGLAAPPIEIPHMDKLVHFVFYSTAMVLGSLFVWEKFRHHITLGRTFLLAFAGLLLYGMLIEVLQEVLRMQRSGEWWDILANTAGLVAGLLFLRYLFYRRKALKWND